MPSSPGNRCRPAPEVRPYCTSRDSATASGVRARKAATWSAFSARRIEHVAYKQDAAGPEHAPRGIEQATLQDDERVEVAGAAMQQHVGLPAHDAGRRARGIEQHGIEHRIAAAIPPGIDIGGIGHAQRRIGADTKALEGRAHLFEAFRVDIECGHAQGWIALQQVRGLAARRGAGVQHARTDWRCQRVGDDLRGAILHRDIARGETRQRGNRDRGFQPQRVRDAVERRRGDARVQQPRCIGIAHARAGD